MGRIGYKPAVQPIVEMLAVNNNFTGQRPGPVYHSKSRYPFTYKCGFCHACNGESADTRADS